MPHASDALWQPVYVGLGSNLDDPLEHVRTAFAQLAGIEDTRLVARSRLYQSAPLGPPDQPDYVNAVAGLLTRRTPAALLEALQAIELLHHRDRSGPKWGPRTLDLDLLLYADLESTDSSLVIPHPHLHERAFVLVPLAEISPDLLIPGRGKVRDLLAVVDSSAVEALD